LAQIQEEMGNVLSRFFGEGPEVTMSPAMDILETDNEVVVKAELPGLKAEDIKVSVENGALTISGEKRQEREQKDRNYHLVQRRFGSFYRSVMLPSGVDADKVDARYHDGVLTLTMPKSEQAKPKKIEIKT
jgi:HSP20 family protein